MVEAKNTYNSGGLNTTGREPFETPYGDNTQPGTGAGTGTGTGTGVDQPTTGQYGEVGGAGNVGVTGGHGHHSHHQHHHERQEHSHHHGAGVGGVTGAGVGTGIGGGPNSQIGDSYGANPTSQSGYQDTTGTGGPATAGAAGTDRFDGNRAGVTGDSYGARDTYPTGGNTGAERGDFVGQVRKDGAVSEAAAVQPGAGQSAIGTNDNEFYNPDRRATGGAYTDDNAPNKTALTGREGSGNASNVGNQSSYTPGATTGNTAAATGDGKPAKTGFMDKLKEVLP